MAVVASNLQRLRLSRLLQQRYNDEQGSVAWPPLTRFVGQSRAGYRKFFRKDSRHLETNRPQSCVTANIRSWSKPCFLAYLFLAMAFTCTRKASGEQQSEYGWRTLRPGLESINMSIAGDFLFSSSILAVRASPARFQPRVLRATEFGSPTSSVKRICQASGASACINANFFDEKRRPLGTVISRGIVHKNVHKGGGTLTGIFSATKNSVSITHRSEFSTQNSLEAFQAGPRLLSNGRSVTGIKASSAQGALSVLCIDDKQRIILAKIALSIFTQYPTKIQNTLRHAPFNCIEALNLDGGGSSQLFAWGQQNSSKLDSSTVIDSPGLDTVPVVFALVSRN